jgi:TRAP transporter TAXI family solute receptor
VESTAGSEENLRRLHSGELDFALLQSDWQYYAGRDGTGQPSGDSEAAAETDQELRAVVSLHTQPFTLLARPEGGVAAFKDLEHKTVNLGAPESALGRATRAVVEALGLDEGDFAEVTALAPADLAEALCGGRIDAFLLPVAHPNGIVTAATERCGARLVPIEGPSVDILLEAWPFYTPATIPGGLYLGNSQAVASFGLRATLVTSTRVAEGTVHRLVRALFEGLGELRGQHPALATLDAEQMVAQGNTLAFHEGALRYYREQGWLQPESAP